MLTEQLQVQVNCRKRQVNIKNTSLTQKKQLCRFELNMELPSAQQSERISSASTASDEQVLTVNM